VSRGPLVLQSPCVAYHIWLPSIRKFSIILGLLSGYPLRKYSIW
jgi:hypothetical protein